MKRWIRECILWLVNFRKCVEINGFLRDNGKEKGDKTGG